MAISGNGGINAKVERQILAGGLPKMENKSNAAFVIRPMTQNDIESLARNFVRYNKEREMYDRFWQEHQEGKRVTLVAIANKEVVGYTNLLWRSDYRPFREKGIPEINNMHVINEFQKQGIGTALIKEAEHIAGAHHKKEIGIGVDLTPHDSTAQRLYPRLGYVPDGRGTQTSPWGDILFLTKPLPSTANTPRAISAV